MCGHTCPRNAESANRSIRKPINQHNTAYRIQLIDLLQRTDRSAAVTVSAGVPKQQHRQEEGGKEVKCYGNSELFWEREHRSYLSWKERCKHNGVWPYTPSSLQYSIKGTQPNGLSDVNIARRTAVSPEKGGGV